MNGGNPIFASCGAGRIRLSVAQHASLLCRTDGLGSLPNEQRVLSVIGVSILTDLPRFGVYRDVVDDCSWDLCCGAGLSHVHSARRC